MSQPPKRNLLTPMGNIDPLWQEWFKQMHVLHEKVDADRDELYKRLEAIEARLDKLKK